MSTQNQQMYLDLMELELLIKMSVNRRYDVIPTPLTGVSNDIITRMMCNAGMRISDLNFMLYFLGGTTRKIK